MTRKEYLTLGADLSIRDENYLLETEDAHIWGLMACNVIMNYVAMLREGLVAPEVATAAILALSAQE